MEPAGIMNNVRRFYQCLSCVQSVVPFSFSARQSPPKTVRTGTGSRIEGARRGCRFCGQVPGPEKPLGVKFSDIVRSDLDFREYWNW